MNSPSLPKALADELYGNCENPLPLPWVKALFTRLNIKYGAAWIAKWRHIPDDSLTHADWAKTLSGCTGESIAYALRFLPDDPPTADQFLKICRNYRGESDKLLLKEEFKRTPESDALYVKTMAEVRRRLKLQKDEAA